MNIQALNAGLKAPEPPLEKVAGSKALSEEQKVAELSRQFEGVLLRQILGQARKTVFHSKTEDESASSAIYQDMVTAQLAESISKSGSFGLAKSLQTQLSRQVLNHTENSHDATAKKPALSPISHEAK